MRRNTTMTQEMGAKALDTGVLVKTYSHYEPLLLTEALHELIREVKPDETVVVSELPLVSESPTSAAPSHWSSQPGVSVL